MPKQVILILEEKKVKRTFKIFLIQATRSAVFI